ncbi:MAG TPA: acyl-CoA dehydrogenase family protein [Acidimicrobiales bacterium]|nr:acyl-CoA dehydrogenase family protein [Acidimicrobiales bacterium]
MEADLFDQFVRGLRHATEHHTGEALDASLEELGWRVAMAHDPRVAVSTLFELQGRANATSSALGQVVAHALGLGDEPETVVLSPIGQWYPPGALDGLHLGVDGLATRPARSGDTALVVASTSESDVAVTVATSSLRLRQVVGVDPGLGLVQVTGLGLDTTGQSEGVTVDWAAAVALGRLALAHELVGTSRTMLELARQHALDRIQFGRPIASFQAVRHRLAETLVGIEMAEAALEAAWLDRSTDTAAMAKAVAGRAARTTARHCQQVLAGIGFTAEHPLHRFVRRTLVLDGMFGTAASITRAQGAAMIDSRALPPLLPL